MRAKRKGRISRPTGFSFLFPLLLAAMPGAAAERLILVVPFENQTQFKAQVTYEASDEATPKSGDEAKDQDQTRWIDRYSHAPRSILEDILVGMDGLYVVERQRLTAVLTQLDIPLEEGFYDSTTALEIGGVLGVNTLVLGTVLAIQTKTQTSKAYGLDTSLKIVKASMRIRVIDVESAGIIYSKRLSGERSFLSSQFGGVHDSDVAFSVMEAALEPLRDDEEFAATLRGGDVEARRFVDVEIRPSPANTDVLVDGVYIGGSPQTVRLPEGQPALLTLRKGGYATWENTIVAREGLVVKPDLAAE